MTGATEHPHEVDEDFWNFDTSTKNAISVVMLFWCDILESGITFSKTK